MKVGKRKHLNCQNTPQKRPVRWPIGWTYRHWGPPCLRSWSGWDPQGFSCRHSSSSFHQRKTFWTFLQSFLLCNLQKMGKTKPVATVKHGSPPLGQRASASELSGVFINTGIQSPPLRQAHWFGPWRLWTHRPISGRGRAKCHVAFKDTSESEVINHCCYFFL